MKDVWLHQKPYSFSKCSENIVFSKQIASEYDLLCIIKKDDIFCRKYDLILYTENETQSFSKDTWIFDISCIPLKMVFYSITLLSKKIHKKYDDLLPKKNTLKDDISGIIKKVIFVLGNMVFLLIESLKMIKEFTFMKRFQWCFVLFM